MFLSKFFLKIWLAKNGAAGAVSGKSYAFLQNIHQCLVMINLLGFQVSGDFSLL